MASEFRVVQLSDCHVSATGDALYRGVDARAALAAVLEPALRWAPDLFLVTGDLAEDFSEEAYAFIAETLAGTGVRVVTTPGNHDFPVLQKTYFPDTAIFEPLIVEAGEWQVIVLNSAEEGEVAGRLSDAMIEGLEEALNADARSAILALHHQPVPVGSRWIDRYPLQDAKRLLDLLGKHKQVKAVLWGHVHQGFRESRDGMLLLGAPSSVTNSLPLRSEFTTDPAGPACRWIRLGANGRLATGLLRGAGGVSPPAAPARG